MPEPISVALIAAISSAVVALINYFAQRPQRKDLKEVKQQVVNDHEKSKYPNTRDELTSTRESVELLAGQVETLAVESAHTRAMVGSVAERLAMTDRNRKDIEDTLSSRDELNEDRLEAAISRHDLDMQRVGVEIHTLTEAIKAHPLICAAFRPVLLGNPSTSGTIGTQDTPKEG